MSITSCFQQNNITLLESNVVSCSCMKLSMSRLRTATDQCVLKRWYSIKLVKQVSSGRHASPFSLLLTSNPSVCALYLNTRNDPFLPLSREFCMCLCEISSQRKLNLPFTAVSKYRLTRTSVCIETHFISDGVT